VGTVRIDRTAFAGDVLETASLLLGAVIVHGGPGGTVAIRLTEVEAYGGRDDPGSHAYRGLTPRSSVMFGPPGHLYVYLSYGVHWCVNVVCGPCGAASAVLLRGGEVVTGAAIARARRPAAARDTELARGPARLAAALGIGGEHNGADLCGSESTLRVERWDTGEFTSRDGFAPGRLRTGPRVGVSGPGGDGTLYPWRFWMDGEPSVSAYRPGTPRRPRASGGERLSGMTGPGRGAGRSERKARP
jgi:DNA-3-methyladenine glycosylase